MCACKRLVTFKRMENISQLRWFCTKSYGYWNVIIERNKRKKYIHCYLNIYKKNWIFTPFILLKKKFHRNTYTPANRNSFSNRFVFLFFARHRKMQKVQLFAETIRNQIRKQTESMQKQFFGVKTKRKKTLTLKDEEE